MARSFTDAIGYVARNEETWVRMINDCWKEWSQEFQEKSEYKYPLNYQIQFQEEMLQKYGIECFVGHQGAWDFKVVDYTKYTFFQMKYAQ